MVEFNLINSTEIRLCQWCGKYFHPNSPLAKYCSDECRDYAKKENNLIRQRRFQNKYQIKDKVLGNSNLKQHRNEDFSRELELIRNERRRLGLVKDYW